MAPSWQARRSQHPAGSTSFRERVGESFDLVGRQPAIGSPPVARPATKASVTMLAKMSSLRAERSTSIGPPLTASAGWLRSSRFL